MKKSERTIQEDFRLMKRGIREFRKILPGQMGLLAWKSVITAVTPYIAVVMSAMILNELAGDGDRARLSAYILISTGATLLISMIGYRLEAKLAVGYDRLFSTHELILTDKAYRVPYHFLEDETVRSLREQVSGSISLTGGGMASLYWDMEVVVKNLCSGGIALILGQQFLWQVTAGVKGGMVSGREAAGMVLLLAALTVVCAYVTCRVSAGRFRVAFDVFAQGAKYNRYGEFYDLRYLPDEDMAMDIRIFRQKELILRESLEKCHRVLAEGKVREMRAVSRLDVAKLLCTGICGAAVYGLAGFLAVRGVIGPGSVLLVSASVTMLINALSELAQIFTDLRNNNVHLLSYFQYMDLEEEGNAERRTRQKEQGGETGTAERKGMEIRFEEVSFCYPGSNTKVLQDISLRIQPGEKLAIVGENGSGKTTLIKLLCRLYRPAEGRILLNGVDIRDWPYEEYMGMLATVFQDFALFAFSVAENVAASGDYNGERVYEALYRAGLWDKVGGLPKGVRQAVTAEYEEDGMSLSGGEAQKLAIARAIYKAAPAVILDEPTAALDPYAEKEIYEQFFRNLKGETMISISHRLSSCRFCDRIIVLEGGRLVQQGSHEELVSVKDGAYARLWESQAGYYCSMRRHEGQETNNCRKGVGVL